MHVLEGIHPFVCEVFQFIQGFVESSEFKKNESQLVVHKFAGINFSEHV